MSDFIDIEKQTDGSKENIEKREETEEEIEKGKGDIDEEEIVVYDEFQDMEELAVSNGSLIEGINEYGFTHPSPIQQIAIVPICNGRNIVAQAQSGTGKTGAFTIGTLARVNKNEKCLQGIILANTRELASQIHYVITNIAKKMDLKITLCVGGSSEASNYAEALTSHILVGTPGRIASLIRKSDEDNKKYKYGEIMDKIETILNKLNKKNPKDVDRIFERVQKEVKINNKDFVSIIDMKKEVSFNKLQKICDILGFNLNLKLSEMVKIIVLDEADVLLKLDDGSSGFYDDIGEIVRSTRQSTQICIFSATYDTNINSVVEKIMKNPLKIYIEKEKIKIDKIKHYKIELDEEDNKFDVIVDIYEHVRVCQAVIFANSKEKVEMLADKLKSEKHSVGKIHSGMSSDERNETLKDFRNAKIRILIATDIISRGIDIEQVGLVINYEVPRKVEEYIHRVGRSGRFGKTGVAVNLFTTKTANETELLRKITDEYKIIIDDMDELEVVNKYLSGSDGYTLNMLS